MNIKFFLKKSDSYTLENIKKLFQELPIGLALCKIDGALVYVNQAYADIIGRTIEETLNLTYWEITPNKYSSKEQLQINSLNSTGKYGPYEKEYIHKNGSFVSVRLNGTLIKIENENYIWSSVEDITEIKRIETELINAKEKAEESELMLKEAQKIAHIGNWNLDLINNKLYWSDEVFNIFGCTSQEVASTYENFLEYIHPDDRVLVNTAYLNHIKTKVPYNIIHRLLLKDGSIKYVNERCNSFFDEAGNAVSSIGTVADITDRIIIEKKLIEEKEKAIKANNAKSEFLSNISHEIRTPMNAIMGFADILKSMETDSEKLEYLNIIIDSNTHLLEIVDDILSISKIESVKYNSKIENINLYKKLNSIFEIYKKQAEKKGILLNLEIDKNIDKFINTDYISIFKIVNNLISNSLKFTQEGYVNIIVNELINNKLEIIIEDTGIGINKEKQKHLYEPFEQGEYYLTKEYGGTGVGLAIVKRLVDILKGEIFIETEIDKGTKVKVILQLDFS
jgi:PAS domain S-box-containing protein